MKENILYFECFSGISGDMTVATLLDLGANPETLQSALQSLNLNGYEIRISRVKKCGIDACDFDVHLTNTSSHTHDKNHHHEHRHLSDIQAIIQNASLSDYVKELSLKMFDYIAHAEAKAHNTSIEKVHFHEVGAIDSIVDIVAVAVCIDDLNIKQIAFSTIYEGQGHVSCQHGLIPVPVPAVLNIANQANIPIHITNTQGELITPTGMAIVATLRNISLPSEYLIKKIGMGAGKKDFPKANLLRGMILEIETKKQDNSIYCLETNIDDSTPEALSFAMEELFSKGAKDVFFTPIYMKKNRPAVLLSILCEEDCLLDCKRVLFQHLSTIGIRQSIYERTTLNRSLHTIPTSFGLCDMKVCMFETEIFVYPEYEAVKKICQEYQLPFHNTFQQIQAEGCNHFQNDK